ncbi:PucR family transcriptional regulator [Kitasatospora sp. NPDC059408]|uniref:PucR family transcriptional regulator n=1 Tax=Kitasatospora sp. NPDC059408 TaxID=3346823 RepID=UPI0036CC2D7D
MPEQPSTSTGTTAPERTLHGLLLLTEAVVELCLAPLGQDVPVLGLDVFDRPEPGAGRGDLLVAVRVDPRSEQALALVRAAGRDGAAGVVFRDEGAGPPNGALRAAAAEAGAALLFRHSWVDWAQLIAALRAALEVAGEPEATTVPLGDLDALAEALAPLVGGAVTIESPHSRVLAYSSNNKDVDDIRRDTILTHRVPPDRVEAMRKNGFFHRLRTTPGALHRRPHGDVPERAAIAVRAGEEILGSIWVAPTDRPLPPTVSDALQAAARVAAAHLLHDRVRRAGQREQVLEAARALLDGRGSADAPARTGLPPAQPCAVLAIAATPESPDTDGRLARTAAGHCTGQGHHALATASPDGARVLLGGLDRDPRRAAAQLTRLADSLARELSQDPAHPVRIGIGEVRDRLDLAAESRRTADLALRALLFTRSAKAAARAFASVADLPDTVALLHALDTLRDAVPPADSSVERLRAHATRTGELVLLDTLRAYLEHSRDGAKAARALNVPAGTFRYRLEKVKKVCGIDLDDPDARLLAHLHLRLTDRRR